MGAIFRREVRSYFTSPIGYIFLAAFYAYSGVMFANYSLESGYTRLDSVFSALLIIIIVLIPVLTMRTISEEKRTKTDQCLLTAPVGLGSIVVGKFLAAFLIYIIAIAITGVFAVVVSAFGTPDWNVVVGNIVALALVGGAYIAIGIFCSSFTENQIVAAVISFIALIFVSFLSTIGNLLPFEWLTTVCEKVSFGERYYSFTRTSRATKTQVNTVAIVPCLSFLALNFLPSFVFFSFLSFFLSLSFLSFSVSFGAVFAAFSSATTSLSRSAPDTEIFSLLFSSI